MNNPHNWEAVNNLLKKYRSSVALSRFWPTAVTSADVKLSYVNKNDSFHTFILGDINSNPDGITTVHQKRNEGQIAESTVEAYLSNIPTPTQRVVVVNLPCDTYLSDEDTWKNTDSWRTVDKHRLADLIDNHQSVKDTFLTVDGQGLAGGESLSYSSGEKTIQVDGYVNLDPVGTFLREATFGTNPRLMRTGANAPPGTWDFKYDITSKYGLLQGIKTVSSHLNRVHAPNFYIAENIKEIKQILQKHPYIVLKGPWGTWGDEVVPIKEQDEIVDKLQKREKEIQSRRDWPAFSLLRDDSAFEFSSRMSARVPKTRWGLVEEAIFGEVVRAGRSHLIVSGSDVRNSSSLPVDFIPLVVVCSDKYNSVVDSSHVPSIVVRVSGSPNLNANNDTDIVEFVSLKKAYKQAIEIPNSGGEMFNLQQKLEEMAGRKVPLEEIQEPLKKAGKAAFASKNITGFKATKQILNEN